MPKGIIFDLDQTLLNTSPLEPYRRIAQRTGNWDRVRDNLHRALKFDVGDSLTPDQLPAAFKRLGFKIAVVTSSPRFVAEGLLKRFRIPYEALVAYRDTDDHKPHPAPFREALRLLGVAASDAYSVGDDWKDVHAAHHAGIKSIGVTWGVTDWNSFAGSAPEVCFHKPSRLLNLDEYDRRGYFGELIYHSDPGFLWHRGSVIWLGPNKTVGFCLGRYFSMSDPRHATSGLSQDIIAFKNDPAGADFFALALVGALSHYKLIGEYRYVMAVPPKPGERSRFKELLANIADQCTLEAIPGLKCVKDYGSIKPLKPAERREKVRGAFTTGYDWNGNNIILIDDVLTSASTTAECIRTLKQGGAGEILTVALGKDQSALDHKLCPRCGRIMRIINGKRGPFWGCSGFRDATNKCDYTENVVATAV